MAMERRDPVPVGRYWIYIDKSEIQKWEDWTKANSDKVFTVATQAQVKTPDGWIWAATPEAMLPGTDGIIKTVAGEWILFDVRSPVPWVGLGFPTIVTDPNVKSSTDVITAPEPEATKEPIEAIRDLVVVAGLFWLATTWLSRKR